MGVGLAESGQRADGRADRAVDTDGADAGCDPAVAGIERGGRCGAHDQAGVDLVEIRDQARNALRQVRDPALEDCLAADDREGDAEHHRADDRLDLHELAVPAVGQQRAQRRRLVRVGGRAPGPVGCRDDLDALPCARRGSAGYPSVVGRPAVLPGCREGSGPRDNLSRLAGAAVDGDADGPGVGAMARDISGGVGDPRAHLEPKSRLVLRVEAHLLRVQRGDRQRRPAVGTAFGEQRRAHHEVLGAVLEGLHDRAAQDARGRLQAHPRLGHRRLQGQARCPGRRSDAGAQHGRDQEHGHGSDAPSSREASGDAAGDRHQAATPAWPCDVCALELRAHHRSHVLPAPDAARRHRMDYNCCPGATPSTDTGVVLSRSAPIDTASTCCPCCPWSSPALLCS